MIRSITTLVFLLYFTTYSSCQTKVSSIVDTTIRIKVNYTVINQDSVKEKQIIKHWEDYLNSGEKSYYNSNSLSFWITSLDFPTPNHFISNIGKDRNEIKNINKSLVSVIALYPIRKDTYALKTMFCYYKDSSKTLMLDNIITVYAIYENNTIKFLSSPQWYSQTWNSEKQGNIRFYYPKGHSFDKIKAIKLDSFNNKISELFSITPINLKYFVCQSNENIYEILGYQFTPNQHVPNQIGAICSSPNLAVFAGNGSEFYPHEVVHLYTAQLWGKSGFYYHSWFDEGIATLFGGSRGYSLEWHLKKLKMHLEQNPKETLTDISKLSTVPNGEFITEYNYAIGGLICKLIYENKGMEGLFDLLKSGSSDDDFYKAIEKHFGVKKVDFGTFIRNELKKIQN